MMSYTLILSFLILILFILLIKKDDTVQTETEIVKGIVNDNYNFYTCPRCEKNNYVRINSLIKVCSSCGWNLDEPYIYDSVRLSKAEAVSDDRVLSDLKVNDQVYIWDDPRNDRTSLPIYNKEGQVIGLVPAEIMPDLFPKISMSKRILAKVKKLNKVSGEIEILITNDLQKMWS